MNTSSILNSSELRVDCPLPINTTYSPFLNTSDVISAYGMFRSMENIEYLDLSSFNTSKIVNTEYMFAYMDKLKEIDLSSFDMSKKNIKTNYMFYDSNKISKSLVVESS